LTIRDAESRFEPTDYEAERRLGSAELRRRACLDENIGAASMELYPEDLSEIEASKFTVQGARYPEELLRATGRR
jgi:hypothetical protein